MIALIAIVVVAAVVLLVPLRWPDALVGGRIVEGIDIDAGAEDLFDYVATPVNWMEWHPASRGVSGVVQRPLALGDKVVETFEIAGRRGETTWTMTALDRPRSWRIEAHNEGGRGGAEIAYSIVTRERGVHFERDIRYRGPNLLFGIVNALKIRAAMRSDSAQALMNIKQRLESRRRA
ncbi:MAG TPA: SRPBCC family protein [Casimicrobiaceae bacterium]|nr:SRPBCC family protein [Casimicrobiaceae bacterium]